MNFIDAVINEEIKLKTKDEKINKVFSYYMKQVFSNSFLNKINSSLNEELIANDFKKNTNIVAYTIGTKLYINSPEFYKLSTEKAMTYVMHEMIHILQNIPAFKRYFNAVEDSLYKCVKSNLKTSMDIFLTGKKQNIHSKEKDEILTYAMNNSLTWSAVNEGTKEKYKKILKDSGMFNLESQFWKKRLN